MSNRKVENEYTYKQYLYGAKVKRAKSSQFAALNLFRSANARWILCLYEEQNGLVLTI